MKLSGPMDTMIDEMFFFLLKKVTIYLFMGSCNGTSGGMLHLDD